MSRLLIILATSLGSLFGSMKLQSSLDEMPENRYALSILLAVNASRSAKFDSQYYGVSKLYSHAYDLIKELRPEVNMSANLLLIRVSLAENEFEQEIFIEGPKAFIKGISAKSKGLFIEPTYFNDLIELSDQNIAYPLTLLELFGFGAREASGISQLDLIRLSPCRFWFSILYCVKYWRTFNYYITIASIEISVKKARAFKDNNNPPPLSVQVDLAEKFRQIASYKFDHSFLSFGNMMCTYYYHEYLRHLLRVACDLDREDEERSRLFDLARNNWTSFLSQDILFKSEKKIEKPVKAWLYQGEFFADCPHSDSIRIRKIKIKRIHCGSQNQTVISSNVLNNNLVVYISSNELNDELYGRIMELLVKRISSTSKRFTTNSITQNIL